MWKLVARSLKLSQQQGLYLLSLTGLLCFSSFGISQTLSKPHRTFDGFDSPYLSSPSGSLLQTQEELKFTKNTFINGTWWRHWRVRSTEVTKLFTKCCPLFVSETNMVRCWPYNRLFVLAGNQFDCVIWSRTSQDDES